MDPMEDDCIRVVWTAGWASERTEVIGVDGYYKGVKAGQDKIKRGIQLGGGVVPMDEKVGVPKRGLKDRRGVC